MKHCDADGCRRAIDDWDQISRRFATEPALGAVERAMHSSRETQMEISNSALSAFLRPSMRKLSVMLHGAEASEASAKNSGRKFSFRTAGVVAKLSAAGSATGSATGSVSPSGSGSTSPAMRGVRHVASDASGGTSCGTAGTLDTLIEPSGEASEFSARETSTKEGSVRETSAKEEGASDGGAGEGSVGKQGGAPSPGLARRDSEDGEVSAQNVSAPWPGGRRRGSRASRGTRLAGAALAPQSVAATF